MGTNESKAAFSRFADCAEMAPEGAYTHAKSVRQAIGEAVDSLMREMRDLGLRVDNCDGAFALEAAIYEWIKGANPDHSEFATAEGFGEAMNGPARDHVLEACSRNVAFFAERRA